MHVPLRDCGIALQNSTADGCWDACRKAAGSLGDLLAVLEALHAAARVLFFRQLLSQAVAEVFEQRLPAMLASLVAAASRAGGQRSHVCDFLGLPRPRSAFLSAPAANQASMIFIPRVAHNTCHVPVPHLYHNSGPPELNLTHHRTHFAGAPSSMTCQSGSCSTTLVTSVCWQ